MAEIGKVLEVKGSGFWGLHECLEIESPSRTVGLLEYRGVWLT